MTNEPEKPTLSAKINKVTAKAWPVIKRACRF